MKKILILVSAFIMSGAAYAMPSIGDNVVFDVTLTQANQTESGTVELQLMSVDSLGNWSEQVTTVLNGQTSTQVQTVTSQNLLTDAQAQGVVADCAANNGVAQTITVPAGTFDACALPVSNANATGTIWISDVTFGIVQDSYTTPQGVQVLEQLQSQTAGTGQ